MEGEEVITLRQMLREHMVQSNEFRIKVETSLTAIETHGKYTRKDVDDNTAQINLLNKAQDRQKGAVWTAVTIGGLALLKMIKELFS